MIDQKLTSFGRELTIKTLIGLLLGVVLVLFTFKFVQVDKISHLVRDLGIWGPIILIFAKALSLVVAPINGTPFYILGSAVYGPLWGSVYTAIGDMVGAIGSFYIARTFGRGIVLKFFSKEETALIPKILDSMSTIKGLFIINTVLITFPDIVNYVAGLSSVKFRNFFLVRVPFIIAFSIVVSYATSLLIHLGDIGKTLFIVFSFVAATVGVFFFHRYGKTLTAKEL